MSAYLFCFRWRFSLLVVACNNRKFGYAVRRSASSLARRRTSIFLPQANTLSLFRFCQRSTDRTLAFAEDLLGDGRFRKKKQERYASASSLLVLNLTLSAVLSKFVLTLLMISETQY